MAHTTGGPRSCANIVYASASGESVLISTRTVGSQVLAPNKMAIPEGNPE